MSGVDRPFDGERWSCVCHCFATITFEAPRCPTKNKWIIFREEKRKRKIDYFFRVKTWKHFQVDRRQLCSCKYRCMNQNSDAVWPNTIKMSNHSHQFTWLVQASLCSLFSVDRTGRHRQQTMHSYKKTKHFPHKLVDAEDFPLAHFMLSISKCFTQFTLESFSRDWSPRRHQKSMMPYASPVLADSNVVVRNNNAIAFHYQRREGKKSAQNF